MYHLGQLVRKSIFGRSIAVPTIPLAEHERIVAALLADHIHELSVRNDLIADLEDDTFRLRFALEAAGVNP